MKARKTRYLIPLFILTIIITFCYFSCSPPGPAAQTIEEPAEEVVEEIEEEESETAFEIGGKPFRFIGAFVPGWYWGQWSSENDLAIITEAKQAGITVLHVMPPPYEYPLGNFIESELVRLDHFVDIANQNGMYVMIPFVHGLGITSWEGSPFYNAGGIEGLIHRPEFRKGFKNHMQAVISRTNTINGLKYSEDPTIMAWMVIEELVSAPFNYPDGFPNVTVAEVADWLEENAAFIKQIDPNHLVTINTTGAIDAFDAQNEKWETIFEVPSLDFIELEDAEARILLHEDWMYTFDRIFALDKPIVMMLSYTSGAIDQDAVCSDYPWQARTMNEVADLYMEKGASGFIVFSWRANQMIPPEFDKCYSYSIENRDIVGALRNISGKLGDENVPPTPLDFIQLAP